MRELAWRRQPRKIIFIRHGEAQHNLEGAAILQEDNPNRKPDNLSVAPGGEQPRHGDRLRRLLGGDGTISAVVSPFERTQQTLYALQQNLGDVRCSARPRRFCRVREQEFGNFQVAEDMSRHKQTEEVGRFYYRRPTGESGADVYDRAASFWDSLLGGSFNMQDLFRRRRAGPDDALLVVTHGLTMRLLMMRYCNWSPQTFDAVYNPGNCDFWVLVKDEARRAYRLEPATARRRLGDAAGARGERAPSNVDHGGRAAAAARLAPGGGAAKPRAGPRAPPQPLPPRLARGARGLHQGGVLEPIEPSTVHSIDWWCGKISEEGVGLRMDKSLTMRRTRAGASRARRGLGSRRSPGQVGIAVSLRDHGPAGRGGRLAQTRRCPSSWCELGHDARPRARTRPAPRGAFGAKKMCIRRRS